MRNICSSSTARITLLAAFFQARYSSIPGSMAISAFNSECGKNGACDGDHFCSTSRGEPHCRPCSDIAEHYCHNITEVTRRFPQCRYFCSAEATKRELNQTLNEERATRPVKEATKRELNQTLNEERATRPVKDETPDALKDPGFIALGVAVAVLVIVVVVLATVLLCRKRRKKPATAKQPEVQPLMPLETQRGDTRHERATEAREVPEVKQPDTVVAQASRQTATPFAHPPAHCDVGYETASSNASLDSAAPTDDGSPAPGPQEVNSKDSPGRSAAPVPARCEQNEAGGRMQVSGAAACPAEAERRNQVTIVNIPTTDDSRCEGSLAASGSRHPGDEKNAHPHTHPMMTKAGR